METASDPKTSRSERDWIVETKYCDSDTSTRRQPDDLHAIIAPAKVRTLLITARIELITQRTAQTQILERRRSTC